MEFGHLEGVPQPYLGNLLAMFINHLLTWMILQVVNYFLKKTLRNYIKWLKLWMVDAYEDLYMNQCYF